MPGLVGFTDNQKSFSDKTLYEMRKLLKHFDDYVDDALFVDSSNEVYGSRTHLGAINQGQQPFVCNDQIYSWINGEFYNQNELRSKYNVDSATDNELLANIYNSTKTFDFLKDVDGYFVAALYDSKEKKIYLITDRFGFKPLYFGILNGELVWSSELKGFLGYDGFKPKIDQQAIERFLDIGYLLENKTWFEGVELLPPASVLSYDMTNLSFETSYYWAWDQIKPIDHHVDEDEIIKELGRLFMKSVNKRVNDEEKIGVALSGGLDSRAILAAIPSRCPSVHTFTFGRKGCDDMRIAREASKVKGSQHHELMLSDSNWLLPRLSCIWKVDGAVSLLHMHGMEFHNEYKSHMDICLNGFAGDLVLGGSFLSKDHLDERINAAIAQKKTESKKEVKDFKEWYLINKTDPYFINNRVRRFTTCGLNLMSQAAEVRIPFFDTELMGLAYGLPDSLRYGGPIYRKMLLKIFPEYYRKIPWQSTGYPISYSNNLLKVLKFRDRIKSKIGRECQRFGFKYRDTKYFTDYQAWIRQEPAKSFFKKHLSNPECLYAEYVPRNEVEALLNAHFSGEDHSVMLCRYLTLEIWLQQIFSGKYRDSEGVST